MGSPLIKVAAFSYGVRKTVNERRDADAAKAARSARKRSRSSKAGS